MNFTDIPYCCNTTPAVSTQVILYETSNIIEIHTTFINSIGPGTMGLENFDGTDAHVVSGRNSSSWSASNEGIRFTPLSISDTSLNYSWTPTTGLSNPNIIDPLASPSTTTDYVVIASVGTCSASDTITIYVDTVINVFATVTPSTICSGDSAQLNATANLPGTSYSWSPTTGLSCSNCPNPAATPTSTTTYSVTATSGSCSGVASVTVTVSLALLAAPCSPITTSFCCGYGIYNVTFNTINNSTANGVDSYQDYTCTNQTNVIADQTYSIFIQTNPGANENVRVWIDYNYNGALDSTELIFASTNVLTNHTGSVTIPSTAVTNKPLRMRVGSDIWSNTPPAACTNVFRGQFEDYAVTVLPNTVPPVADFDINILSTCQGIVSFTDQSNFTPTSWYWDFGDGSGLSTVQNPFYTYSLPGTYNVTLIVTNPWGSDTLSQQITINSLTADFTVSNDTVNLGEIVNYFDNSIGANSWNWDFGDGDTSALQNPFHAYVSAGSYTIMLIVTNDSGCISQMLQQIFVLDCAGGPQTGSITGPVNVNELASGNYSVTFHDNSTYNWTVIGGNQTSGGQTNFITVQWGTSGIGQLMVVETDSLGCIGDTVSLTVNIGGTGISNAALMSQGLKIVPNPNTGEFTLEINPDWIKKTSNGVDDLRFMNYDCIIYDVFGRLVSKFKILDQKTMIDLSNNAKGVYNLQIVADKNV